MMSIVKQSRNLLRGSFDGMMSHGLLKQLQELQVKAIGLKEHLDEPGHTPLPTFETSQFNNILQRKQEFREHASSRAYSSLENGWRESCADKGEEFSLTDLQLLLKNFLSSGTPYNSVLLNHGVGVGKTCTAVTIAENFPDKKVMVLTSPGLQNAFKKQVFDVAKLRTRPDGTLDLGAKTQCTGTTYIDMIPNAHLLNTAELDRRISALISKRYKFLGMDRFANIVSDLGEDPASEQKIRSRFSNMVILVDEAHHLRSLQGIESKRVTTILNRVLQFTERVKLVLMTATPMYNDSRDLIDLVNLMLVNDKRKSIKVSDVFDERGTITASGAKVLRSACRGYVTYMPGGSPYSFPKRLTDTGATPAIGLPSIDIFGRPIASKDRISRLLLTCSTISKIQGDAYAENAASFANETKNDRDDIDVETDTDGDLAEDPDIQAEGKRRGRALRIGTQLLNVVYPSEKSWAVGIKGFSQCFDRDARAGGTLRVSYRKDVEVFLDKPLLKSYSPKIQAIVASAIACKGISMCYSRFVWSGAVPLAIAFEHAGFTRFGSQNILKSGQVSAQARGQYIIVTGSQEVGGDADAEILAARATTNVNGENIKVIIVTSKASEGVDLRFVRQIHILEPWYNLQKLTQIFGRASRHCSHALLPAAKRNFTLFLHAIRGNGQRETLDLRAYRISESKQRRIDEVQRVLHSSSFDCAMNIGKISEDKRMQSTDADVEDCYGVKRKVLGKSVDGFNDVAGVCDVGLTGETDTSTYDLDRHSYGLEAYERGIRAHMLARDDVSYETLKEHMMLHIGDRFRDDFLSMVLSRMIERREPIRDVHGRSCTIKHRDKFYIAEPLDDGSMDPTVRPRRRLVVGLSGKGKSSRFVPNATASPLSRLSSPALMVKERTAIMAAELSLDVSADSKSLSKRLDGVMQDAVIDRLSWADLKSVVSEAVMKGSGKIYKSLVSAGVVVGSTNDNGTYVRDFTGKWLCSADAMTDCDAFARVDPAVIECMASNRAIRATAAATLLRNSKGVSEFRLLTKGSTKQGSICTQTSTYTLQQLRTMCVASLQLIDKTIPVSPLDVMPKKRLCRVYELAMRLNPGVIARPSQMLDV